MPIVVNGTSNLPPGISVDIVLTKSGFTTEELKRETVTLQANKEFSVVFDTSGYSKGVYKVEVPAVSGYWYLGNSVTLKVVRLKSTGAMKSSFGPSPPQEMDGTLDIEGIISGLKNSGVQIGVTGPGGEPCSGRRISRTAQGSFSPKVPIETGPTTPVSPTGGAFRDQYVHGEKTQPTTIPTTVPDRESSRVCEGICVPRQAGQLSGDQTTGRCPALHLPGNRLGDRVYRSFGKGGEGEREGVGWKRGVPP